MAEKNGEGNLETLRANQRKAEDDYTKINDNSALIRSLFHRKSSLDLLAKTSSGLRAFRLRPPLIQACCLSWVVYFVAGLPTLPSQSGEA